MKPKTFFITELAEISRHKVRGSRIVGCGMLHEDQLIVVYTTERAVGFNYEELKLGSHFSQSILNLNKDEKVLKIDIIHQESAYEKN